MTPAVCGALALAALGAGFGLVQWLYTRRLLARLDRMLAGAVDGSFRESRFDESRLSALEGRLARFLNGSAASARELEGKRAAIQTLISDISHQTKTPIANILLYASLLAEGELSPEQAAQAATLSRQAEKLSFLIQALVKASRLETGIITTAPEPQPVGPLLEGALAQARPQAEAKGLTLAAEPCGAAARFDRKWTAEALFNVVDNAVKYTPAGGRVTLSAVPLGQFCRWTCPTPASASQRRSRGGSSAASTGAALCGRRRGWASASTWSGRSCGGRGAMSRWLPTPAREPPFPSISRGNRADLSKL